MNKKISSSILLLLFLIPPLLYSQNTQWAKSFGGTASDKGISIGTDSLGFIYISGYYNNEATFDGITLSNTNQWPFDFNKENFVAKLDSTGNVIWAIPGGDQEDGCCDDEDVADDKKRILSFMSDYDSEDLDIISYNIWLRDNL